MTRKGEIDGWRREIDAIDDRIVDLVLRRARCAIRIGRAKRKAGVPVRDRAREAAVLARLAERARGRLEGRDVRWVFSRIMELMRRLEEDDARNQGEREGARSPPRGATFVAPAPSRKTGDEE
ncbi:chorismate mutase [bacterium]|nr:chorismate mutase [bacterium]